MVQWREQDLVPEARLAAEKTLAEPQDLPDPVSLSLVEWLRRVPEYLAPIETLGDALTLRRTGDPISPFESRLAHELVGRLTRLRRHFELIRRIADNRDMFAETFDPTREPWRNWQREFAFRSWRDGERQVAHPNADPHREEYEGAIAQMLVFLRQLSSVDELIAMYFSERYKAPLRVACATDPHQARLWHVLVLDAACWRRVRQLIADLLERR